MKKTKSYVSRLFCPKCDNDYSIDEVMNLCECGSPLLVDYDYISTAKNLTKDVVSKRKNTMWRYREVLPVLNSDNIITLGEGGTSLLKSKNIGSGKSIANLYFKDESTNPTGSFKARGLCMAVSRAKELGLSKLVIPTAGNAGSALAAYCASAGLEAVIFMPKDTPSPFMIDCNYHNAIVKLVDGTIKDCGAEASKLVSQGYFSVATLKEPYRIEGKKTMGYEIAEHFDYSLPDVIIYPTGGGTGLIGMWKAFDEMEKMGWIDSKRPKMVSVQSEGCAPIVKAFDEGNDSAELWQNPHTCASGLRVPSAVGDFLILKALKASHGTAIAVSEEEIINCSKEISAKEGIFPAPEGGASLAAFHRLFDKGFIKSTDKVVIFITGSGYKYIDVFK